MPDRQNSHPSCPGSLKLLLFLDASLVSLRPDLDGENVFVSSLYLGKCLPAGFLSHYALVSSQAVSSP